MRKPAFLLAVVTALTGCVSHRATTAAEIAPRTGLVVHFAAPRALTFKAAGNDTLAFDDVIELQGRVIKPTADSVTIAAASVIRFGGDAHRFGQGTTTAFALTDVRMQEVQQHTGRTIALVATLVLGLALLIAVATYEEPPPPPPPAPKPKE